ncbi:MAG: pyruvate kinase [bacterium]|nr:pyruvate kinase [bacterium]
MINDINLIATLPRLDDKYSIDEIMRCNEISSVRFNSGVDNLMTASEIVSKLKELSEFYHKKIWIDLKGRQLRINAWADPRYDVIELNHDIEVEYPAEIIFRNSTKANIFRTRKNKITIDRQPQRAVGKGQSVNIMAKSLLIKGYLTDMDKQLLIESSKEGLNDYMASFVESEDDLKEILSFNKQANIISKIESVNGLDFINNIDYPLSLMAARDDLYIETKMNKSMLKALRYIISKDKNAICASKIFSSLEKSDIPSLSDYEDIELMLLYGYRNFMIQDDVKGPTLKRIIECFKEF